MGMKNEIDSVARCLVMFSFFFGINFCKFIFTVSTTIFNIQWNGGDRVHQ